MKVFAAILLLATMAQSRPRHILVPYDDEIEQPQVMIDILLIPHIKFGHSEKAKKFEKIFHLKFDATQ